MACLGVLTNAQLLPLVSAYQEGVNQDVRILTRLGHSPPDGDLGPLHALMAPWLDRVGLRFVHQLCPSLVFSYVLEYGRVDLVRELMATNVLRLIHEHEWCLRIGTRTDCVCKHRHVQHHYADRCNGTCINGHLRHLAAAACLGGHVELLRFVMETSARAYLPSMLAVALCAGGLGIAQELLEKRVISAFKDTDMRLAVASGSADLVAFLVDNSSDDMIAEAFKQASVQNQFALLQWLCTTYNEPRYWRMALSIAATNLQHDVIAYFATTHDLHLTPAEAARVQRRRKRLNDDEPARVTRSRN
ncbi:hypothetical protein SPRG_09739 [Saprolegnia parasitica CBS 223.65]|uniref:Uncharacterized protein n=1 Tax=Saprolegnia parasitica (strain CBS 223.65) TaxID=695850 RepID=A0A067C2J4_SAPPC|nr:hypothetical protein SPRG_09739 [Saprolegnia parasitica CBS 223.65]KDO25009.1 hypothetical protein SPRG_09739 [Saprolegnia parasitica CBS 223.65]|eukprot:XP_012204278.1 hypothetical protein SPRG_09739 [Saprolegnia parasitica CBS 223.65]